MIMMGVAVMIRVMTDTMLRVAVMIYGGGCNCCWGGCDYDGGMCV